MLLSYFAPRLESVGFRGFLDSFSVLIYWAFVFEMFWLEFLIPLYGVHKR